MCLFNVREIKLKKDRVCYKVVSIYPYCFGNNLITPYRHAEVKLGEEMESNISVNPNNTISVAIHSFITLKDAIKDVYNIKGSNIQDLIIKCIIPKDAVVYEGNYKFDNTVPDSYASNKIIYGTQVVYIASNHV